MLGEYEKSKQIIEDWIFSIGEVSVDQDLPDASTRRKVQTC